MMSILHMLYVWTENIKVCPEILIRELVENTLITSEFYRLRHYVMIKFFSDWIKTTSFNNTHLI